MNIKFRTVVSASLMSSCLALSACSSTPPPAFPGQPAATSSPILTPNQIDRIFTGVIDGARAADSAGKSADLGPRFGEPAISIRQRKYDVKAKVPARSGPAPFSNIRQADVVTISDTWPKMFMSVHETIGEQAPAITVLTQQDVWTPWKVRLTASLLPGAELPELAAPETGTAPINAQDGAGLVASPQDALAKIGSVLNDGMGSPDSDLVDRGDLLNTISNEQSTEKKAVNEGCDGECVKYWLKRDVRPDSVWALKTTNGGALAVGVIDAERNFEVAKDNVKIPLNGELKQLSGKDEAAKKLQVKLVEVVVFSVPPAGQGKIKVVGSDRTLFEANAE